MYMSEIRSRIEIEQRKQLNSMIFVLIVVLFSVVTSAVAPQLLYEYVLQDISVDQQLLILQYIPVGAYLVSLVAFVMSAVGFMNHRRRVRMHEQEILMMEYSDEDCNCEDPSHFHNLGSNSGAETVPSSSVSDLSAALSKSSSSTKRTTASRKRRTTKKSSK